MDITAPCIAIGQVLGRMGCFISGDGCYGRPTTLPWGLAFPDGAIPINTLVHPTPLYEAFVLLIVFVVLWSLRLQGLPRGRSIGIYLIASGRERFFVEFIRLHHKVWLGMTAYQIASVVLILLGSYYFLYSLNRQITPHTK
jgi:phosphatidylglycerol:prolipoprotein diacylglycerol transferase